MSNRDRNFWIEQAKDQLLANEKRADSAVVELMFLYDEAANQVEREIYAMFAKFATDNKLTDAEASRLLSGKEYSVWRKSIQEYIKEASGAAEDSPHLTGIEYPGHEEPDQPEKSICWRISIKT